MTYTHTPILNLALAVVGSGQAFSTSVVNDNFTAIDTAVGDLQTTIGDGQTTEYGTTVGGLTVGTGRLAVLAKAAVTGAQADLLLRYEGTQWFVESHIVVMDTYANATDFAVAFVNRLNEGQRIWVEADSGREYRYEAANGLVPTTLIVSATAPVNPASGQTWLDIS